MKSIKDLDEFLWFWWRDTRPDGYPISYPELRKRNDDFRVLWEYGISSEDQFPWMLLEFASRFHRKWILGKPIPDLSGSELDRVFAWQIQVQTEYHWVEKQRAILPSSPSALPMTGYQHVTWDINLQKSDRQLVQDFMNHVAGLRQEHGIQAIEKPRGREMDWSTVERIAGVEHRRAFRVKAVRGDPTYHKRAKELLSKWRDHINDLTQQFGISYNNTW